MNKKIVQFQVGDFGQVYVLYEDGSMAECEQMHSAPDSLGGKDFIQLKVVREIKPPNGEKEKD